MLIIAIAIAGEDTEKERVGKWCSGLGLEFVMVTLYYLNCSSQGSQNGGGTGMGYWCGFEYC